MSSTNLVTIRSKTNLFNKSRSQDALNEMDSEQKIKVLDQLEIGDHIVVSIDLKSYCHAILESVDLEKHTIQIIYYDDTHTQCSLSEYSLSEPTECRVVGVKRDLINVNFSQISIYKVIYELTENCLPLEETIQKAQKCLGQTKYNIFVNNDEHFCIFCKTGKAAKLFIVNPNDIRAKNIIGKDLSEKVIGNLAQEGVHILLVNTAKHIATKFPRSAVSAGLPAAAEAAGSVIGVGIEGISMGVDLYKAHKNFKEGKTSEMKFKKYIARRVTRGTMGVAGGVAGGILGQMVIPVPVVGAVVGSLVGGIVGAAAGQVEGLLLGELIEVIDNKIKENDKKDQKIEEKFNVIQKLVFRFDKDILKADNYAHLTEINVDIVEKEELNLLRKEGAIVENISSQINDDDYEIYILDDSNEVVTNLNLDGALDENGIIDKRKSIEAFSSIQLPDNINVFFKVLEQGDD
ncbi:unnamed protein product [Brachionus calyciflorus]|uniref:LRAT domain-containing protein n=1 Tax=Brachionus calyciflorus TaxID=104777 RepID=A0A813QT48_9BILA|nr:unnamed protein product [Brachionus calyciflorus]